VSFDFERRVKRIEEAGRRFATEVGLVLEMGAKPDALLLRRDGRAHGRSLFEVISKPVLGADASALLRLDPLRNERSPRRSPFQAACRNISTARESEGFAIWGPSRPRDLRESRLGDRRIEPSDEGIRATVIGRVSIHDQVSGSTIFVAPHSVLP